MGDEVWQHRILNCLGWLRIELGDLEGGFDLNRRGADGARKRGDHETIANAEINLGDVFIGKGDLALAHEVLDGVHRLVKHAARGALGVTEVQIVHGQGGGPDVECRKFLRANEERKLMTSPAARKPMPPRGYLLVIRTIDRFTELTSYLFVLVIIPLIFANVVEVFARYVLRAPTIWALDVTTMSYATLFMLGAALALLKGAHVRTDML